MSATIIVTGNIGKDPEMQYTGQGTARTTFSVGSAEKVYQDGEYVKKTTWYNVTVLGKNAERAAEWLHKGNRVQVIGPYNQREYKRNDGTTAISNDITANTFENQTPQSAQVDSEPAEKPAARGTSKRPTTQTPLEDDDIPF